MYYVDETTITVRAGNGGGGKVSFLPRKGGPDGGNGGKGGDVYAVLDTNLATLASYVGRPAFAAEHGNPGGFNKREGKKGEDLYILMPPHTTLTDTQTQEVFTIDAEHPRVLLCKGGAGGLGNDMFKSPTNRAPRKSTPGYSGQERQLKVVMTLLATYGFVGLPNAGKSSLLNQLTAADVRTAPYPFTTLEPNLGVCDGTVLADIPGLIEGASQGKGLGTKFLRHVEKVQMLLHCISAESADVEQDYRTICAELGAFSPTLRNKQQVILLTKCDIVSEQEREQKKNILKACSKEVISVSLYQPETIETIRNFLHEGI